MYKSGLVELEAVVAVARHGSFRAAALELDMSPTAIGNAVASLEKRLGVRLFNRTTRNVALTSAGREYVEAIAPALSDIRSSDHAVDLLRRTALAEGLHTLSNRPVLHGDNGATMKATTVLAMPYWCGSNPRTRGHA